ncbi:MAG: hypothetical protein A3A28_02920 [Candidatus Sungbacteria bacterium RIFCSPLOWO2_01_FULL_47_32]|uniref:Uncharacterized protein n=1 Tax=Candidatus Sungbacteria bacterium RIFCSPHIGHO2_01_FULL_47_32 TaxID=1802264 RepID=A0A1G2K2E6_9BACT|nr:MAG: hypothetical protein UX72_C0050G0002 [Parcubacteria group bacterium GW2011_GWA2_47_10]OGZ93582.1 MAG: hypothetical protein A2633_04460 [Candidatus Sungbacteria bacterium RIFCSPHIGHO2_01_FULL_47_32]OHA05424.1 MAG: hypothetical protein A3A28_02920 [Candidatus Sungbacteria bacterium RIFCSPLOWO2_01_FULL_47_32]
MRKISADKIRANILELCSESEYGSWEFWSTKRSKTEVEGRLIVQVISELVKEKKIYPMEYESVADQTYKPVRLDISRLKNEIKRSIKPYNVNPHKCYWFLATDEEKEDLRLRRDTK